MNRTLRVAVAVLAMGMIAVATVLAAPSEREQQSALLAASHQPSAPGDQGQGDERDEAEEREGPPSQDELQRLVGKLADAGIDTNAAMLEALAAEYGVGGAVRLLAWAQESGRSTENLAAMFDSGMGWGEIGQELGGLHPGIGSIMGGGQGLGRADAPGQNRD